MTAQSELPTAALRLSQATHAAVDNSQHHLLDVYTLGTGSCCTLVFAKASVSITLNFLKFRKGFKNHRLEGCLDKSLFIEFMCWFNVIFYTFILV